MGLIGFIWLIFWLIFYEKPEKQKRLSAAELVYINGGEEEVQIAVGDPDGKKEKTSWFKLLGYKQTWAFTFGKFMTDGVWWFFLFWLPAFLKAQYGIVDKAVMLPLAVLYTMAMAGSIGGGWFPMYFIKKGYAVYDGRMKAMLLIAVIPLVVLLAQPLGHISYWMPVIFIGIGASAHQAWSANIFTTVSDMFPKKAIGSVVGIGGMAGGIGGVLVTKVGGWLFDTYRNAGIAGSWIEAKARGLGDYLSQIQAMSLVNKHGDKIFLDHTELGKLPKEIVSQLQAVDSAMFDQLWQLQKPLVQAQMTAAYTIMFAFCAVAYLIAWTVMKLLVPKYKPITDL
jgi:ACS family hexuronate transporter-like MFS transporter